MQQYFRVSPPAVHQMVDTRSAWVHHANARAGPINHLLISRDELPDLAYVQPGRQDALRSVLLKCAGSQRLNDYGSESSTCWLSFNRCQQTSRTPYDTHSTY